ncbi:hypothetical protein GCM10025864_41910 [Luteimicrobium album]|uniref:Uncharacterized protein n=1 Tax=Luteimicrobium album TaxID=1054550 RepID=A0ABQ6I880_9MICO|nr:hypothetical protein GCM10025864_41910 [Luteimicrobium album]
MLLHPAAWEVDDALRSGPDGARLLVGADAVHRQLVAWLAALGLGPGAVRADDAGPSAERTPGEPATGRTEEVAP